MVKYRTTVRTVRGSLQGLRCLLLIPLAFDRSRMRPWIDFLEENRGC